MPTVVFDVDGTLTDTVHVDMECYEAAIYETIGVEIPSNWRTFEEVTDAAILETACALQGRPIPDAETVARIARRVGELLGEILAQAPERFAPIRGADLVFDALRSEGWVVAMATGAWRQSAVVKLRGAGVPTDGVALATSSDHRARKDIIRHAVTMSRTRVEDGVVYVGDGTWDGRAARSLGFGFVGVGGPERDRALREAGAVDVVVDLADTQRLERALDRALADGRPRP